MTIRVRSATPEFQSTAQIIEKFVDNFVVASMYVHGSLHCCGEQRIGGFSYQKDYYKNPGLPGSSPGNYVTFTEDEMKKNVKEVWDHYLSNFGLSSYSFFRGNINHHYPIWEEQLKAGGFLCTMEWIGNHNTPVREYQRFGKGVPKDFQPVIAAIKAVEEKRVIDRAEEEKEKLRVKEARKAATNAAAVRDTVYRNAINAAQRW